MNWGPESPSLRKTDQNNQRSPNLSDFKDFCRVDLQLTEGTASLHARQIKKHLEAIRKEPKAVTKEDLRAYLMSIKENMAPSTYKNILASLKRYYRDFLGKQDLVETFKFPELNFKLVD